MSDFLCHHLSLRNNLKMIEFENYKTNLDLNDTLGLKHVNVSKAVSYTGDVNAIRKKNEDTELTQPLAAAIVGLNCTAAPLPSIPGLNAWTNIDAQELMLDLKPTCYLILSKPGAGAFRLGQAMSKKLNCSHLCPKTMISDEIEQQSFTGKCIDFNMKHNKALKFDTFFKMLKIKLESPAIQHRGYIITGLPLVTASRCPKYFMESLYGEEAFEIVSDLLFDTITNLKKKKPKKLKQSTESMHTSITSEVGGENLEEEAEEEQEEELEEEEELKVELPKFFLNTCSDIIHPIKPYYNSKKAVLSQQLNDLFSLSLKPDIIIYLSCPDKDLVTKKSHKYINYKNNHNVNEPFIAKTPLEVRWPVRYTTSDYIAPIDNEPISSKYWCRQPMNFNHNSVEQMCNYKNDLFPLIENILKDIDPKCVIKLDARLKLHELMHNVSERLLMMPIMPVIIPEPLFMEEPPEEMDEFWQSIEELNVIRSGTVAFKRCSSLWANRCPVELKKRISMRGNPKLAVTFLKNVYLIASLDNMVSFCKNPRPYLKLKYLEPTCRIIVSGTPLSGKTMISECLSWLFDSPIINYNNFLQTEIQKKYDTYAKRILSEIIATIEDARFANWQSEDLERGARLDAWCKSVKATLKEYIPLLSEYLRFTALKAQNALIESKRLAASEQEEIEEESIESGGIESEETEYEQEETKEEETLSVEFLNEYNTKRNHLYFLPFLDDLDACNNALSKEVMAQYGPIELTTPIKKPNLPFLGDKDVTEAIAGYIVANELQTEMQPTMEELMKELTSMISSTDAERQKQTNFEEMYGKYIIDGFPSDPEYWNILVETKLLPDYTVTLVEYREIESELIETYKTIGGHMKNHQERYMLANDPLIKTKLKNGSVPETDIAFDINIILNNIIQNVDFAKEETTEADLWTSHLTENIDKFKEDWDSIKLKLEDSNKCFIDVELENKTDIKVVEEVLLRLRKSYFISCEVNEDDGDNDQDEENEIPKDIITYNDPRNFGETGIYCPVSYYDHGVLWEGKPEFSAKFDNSIHRLVNEECLELFQKDVTKYQSLNKPFKPLPPLRICVIGCIGSGKTTISKLIAKELGLMHIDFAKAINDFLMPNHFKKVGRRYENVFTDVPIDDEAVMDLQMDEDNENLITDILSNETELRRMIYDYFERGAPLLPQLMQRLITKLWYQEPFKDTGFILDGYPRLPTDVEDMAANYCIPDLVIEIEGNSENALKRLSPNMFKAWKMQLSEAKDKARKRLDDEKKKWMDFLTKTIVVKLICDEILENMFFSSNPVKQFSNASVIIDAHPSGSVIDANLFSTYNELIQEFPEPVDQSEWEKFDEARERIDTRLEGIYESDDENIQSLKENLTEQRIKTVSVNGNKSLNKVNRLALSKLTNLRNRCDSFFEKTTIVSPDIAEVLILEGFCFMSKFNRMCPVYIYENPHTIQNIYNINKRKSNVFTVIHRAYIYFICGEESTKKFRTNPLKYVSCNNIREFIAYPLTIGVIGPPKSGKSTLAANLAKRYGLICLSRGKAVRDVFEDKHWTELATKMLTDIASGECIQSDYIMKAVQAMAMDYRTSTSGFVLDGFPDTATEAMELVNYGLYPNIVFDISTDMALVGETSQKEIYYEILKRNPPYSRPFVENRYRNWQGDSYKIRNWIGSDYQNMHVLDGSKSRWQCLHDAVNVINNFIPKVNYYLTKVKTSIVLAHVMGISNKAFQERMSNFKNMCPLCLRKNVLKHNAYPVDKSGVVQYQNKFYWICSEHMSMVLKNPDSYLSMEKVDIPELPVVVKTINKADIHENGVCMVTYAEHLPAQKITVGTIKHAACFKGKTYLFCSQICLDKFMARPHMYYDITVFQAAKSFPSLSLKDLPNIGYLEQTLGGLITEACCFVNVLRPKYPGLSFQLSGVLYIALYLKTHNPRLDKAASGAYRKASKTFDARCRLLMNCALFLRSMDNPFANYPACCKSKHQSGKLTSSSRSTMSFETYL